MHDPGYIPAGLMWGWRVLSPTGPFADGAPVTGANRARKVLVLMTDGENTRSLDAPYHWGSSKSDADTLLSTLCTKVKSASIEIYTVAFEVTDNQTRNMLRNCATARLLPTTTSTQRARPTFATPLRKSQGNSAWSVSVSEFPNACPLDLGVFQLPGHGHAELADGRECVLGEVTPLGIARKHERAVAGGFAGVGQCALG